MVKVFEVFTISVMAAVKLLEVDDCHFDTAPVFPLNVSVVLLVVEHKMVPPVTVPPTDSGFTVIVIALDVAGEPDKHGVAFEVITTVIISLFEIDADVYVALLAPTLVPFNFHWYEGAVPPLVGVAVKVTLDPIQIAVSLAPILTLAGKLGLTVMVPVAFTVPQPPVKGML